MLNRLALVLAGFACGGAAALDCSAIINATSDDTGKPIWLVHSQAAGNECLIECDGSLSDGTTPNRACYTFGDGVNDGFEKAGLKPKSQCTGTAIEYPFEKADEEDLEMVVTSCPQWFLWCVCMPIALLV